MKSEQNFLQWIAAKLGMNNPEDATAAEVQQTIIDAQAAEIETAPTPVAEVATQPAATDTPDDVNDNSGLHAEIARLTAENETLTNRVAELEAENTALRATPAATHTDGADNPIPQTAKSQVDKELAELGAMLKAEMLNYV